MCEGRNSNRRERLKRRKTNDFNMKKTDVVIIFIITLKCIDPFIPKKFLQIVHRRTYKELLSTPFIEKCIFQFDLCTSHEEVSGLCILQKFPY